MNTKLLVLVTAVILLLLVYIMFPPTQTLVLPNQKIDTSGQPTLGNPQALVHVVVFEEPKCPSCKVYNNNIAPQIKKQYVDTNKILYTVIPVSFISRSGPASEALMCVYNQDGDQPNARLFFSYLDYMYLHQPPEDTDWATTENMIKFAKESSLPIDTKQLENCIKNDAYRLIIAKNLDYARAISGGSLTTPAVFVNGTKVEKISSSNISSMIDAALREKGVK